MNEADKLQVKGIMMKIKLGLGGILALVGTKLFGVAGGIAGFFTGVFSGSIFKWLHLPIYLIYLIYLI